MVNLWLMVDHHVAMVHKLGVNYNDLTATSLEIMVNKGNHPQMAARFRLVKYCNLPRIMQLAGSKEGSCPDRPCDNELRATDPRLPAAVSHNSAPDTPVLFEPMTDVTDADAEAAEDDVSQIWFSTINMD